MHERRDEKPRWLDDPRHVDLVYYGVVASCAVLVLLDLVVYRKAYFAFEGLFGFYGWYGFVGCVFLVLAAKQLRKILMRGEDYYERHRE